MKLASLVRGGRDGTLVVVSRDLRRAATVGDIAPTLQRALEDWTLLAPRLEDVAGRLEAGTLPGAFEFEWRELASAMPRSHQMLDGSVYLSHMEKARRARGAQMPADAQAAPLVYQGLSDHFLAPHGAAPFADDTLGIDLEAEVAVIVDDVPMGVDAAAAAAHIRLLVLLNDWTLRGLTALEVPRGFGFLQSKPASALSPVAVTPDELGAAWDGRRVALPLLVEVNGRRLGAPHAGQDMAFDYGELIAHAARTRRLGAGTVIGAGTVSNRAPGAGYACLAEARMDEQIAHGAPRTPFLAFGDSVRIEMRDGDGHSIFGAIEQTVARAGAGG